MKYKFSSAVLSMGLICNSCTINISLADTHGTASDVIDDTHSPTNTADVKIPLGGK